METQLIIALLCICIRPCLAASDSGWDVELGERDDQRDVLQPPEAIREMDASCIVPDGRGLNALGQQDQLDMKLKFQLEHQRQQLHRCASNNGNGKQKMMQTIQKYDDYEDAKNTSDDNGSIDDANGNDDHVDDENADDDDNSDDDSTARISCILRSLNETTKSLCGDLKRLSVALTPNSAKSSSESLKKKNNNHKAKPKNRKQSIKGSSKNRVLLKKDGYVDADNCDADAIDRDGLMPKHLSNEMRQVALRQKEEEDWESPDIIEEQLSADAVNCQHKHRPFVMPTDRLSIPPLLQMLNRQSRLPLTPKKAPNQGGSRRCLQAHNEMRLNKAVQAASAAQKSNMCKQEHVQKFKENLKRLISNRAAIERRLSGLLSGPRP